MGGKVDIGAAHAVTTHALTCITKLSPLKHCTLTAMDCVMQIAKLLIIPFVCLVEKFWLGKEFTRGVVTSVLIVVTGVAVV